MPVDVRPATADRWGDLIAVFGRRGEDPSWCWCQLFIRPPAARPPAERAAPDNRDALYQEIRRAAVAPGLIAYVNDHPVGWTRAGPRAAFPGVTGNKALSRVLTKDDPGVWWVTCFAVNSDFRRSGVGLALLEAAVELARHNGATAVEGHPVDVARLKAAHVAASALYTGTRAMFAAAGFAEVARTYPTRPVMRLSL